MFFRKSVRKQKRKPRKGASPPHELRKTAQTDANMPGRLQDESSNQRPQTANNSRNQRVLPKKLPSTLQAKTIIGGQLKDVFLKQKPRIVLVHHSRTRGLILVMLGRSNVKVEVAGLSFGRHVTTPCHFCSLTILSLHRVPLNKRDEKALAKVIETQELRAFTLVYDDTTNSWKLHSCRC